MKVLQNKPSENIPKKKKIANTKFVGNTLRIFSQDSFSESPRGNLQGVLPLNNSFHKIISG